MTPNTHTHNLKCEHGTLERHIPHRYTHELRLSLWWPRLLLMGLYIHPAFGTGQPRSKKSRHMRGTTYLIGQGGPAHPPIGRHCLVCLRPKHKRLLATESMWGLEKRWVAWQEGCFIYLLLLGGQQAGCCSTSPLGGGAGPGSVRSPAPFPGPFSHPRTPVEVPVLKHTISIFLSTNGVTLQSKRVCFLLK